jgi:hypothetical protein
MGQARRLRPEEAFEYLVASQQIVSAVSYEL